MRFTRPKERRGIEEPMLPLINIVFLLLIFFMVAGRLTSSDPLEVNPPRSAAEDRPDAAAPTLLLSADGSMALEGEMVQRDELAPALAALREQGLLHRLRLRADGAADTPEVVAVMELLRENGVERLHLVTQQRRDSGQRVR